MCDDRVLFQVALKSIKNRCDESACVAPYMSVIIRAPQEENTGKPAESRELVKRSFALLVGW